MPAGQGRRKPALGTTALQSQVEVALEPLTARPTLLELPLRVAGEVAVYADLIPGQRAACPTCQHAVSRDRER